MLRPCLFPMRMMLICKSAICDLSDNSVSRAVFTRARTNDGTMGKREDIRRS